MAGAIKSFTDAIKGFASPTPRETENEEAIARADCRAKGGTWDAGRKMCVMPPTKQPEPKVLTAEDIKANVAAGKPPGFLEVEAEPLTPKEKGLTRRRAIDELEQMGVAREPGVSAEDQLAKIGQERTEQQRQLAEGQQLAGQVGEFGALGIQPTGLDVGEAATTGIVGAIPRALSLAAGGAAIGAVGGTAVLPGIGTAGGAAIGAVGGFVSGLASSMISNFKSQRSDTTTAQQRILDEGKQTMKDWVTLAKSDPANRAFYLAEYNKQSAQIDQAHRQMKLDTSRDLAKFETALPNLAEFESFYSQGGERDTLDIEMQIALQTQAPEGYEMLELSDRRKTNE